MAREEIHVSKPIAYGDDGYDDVYADWVTNARASQFDRSGSWGGACYRVLDTSETYPTFYQYASEEPTTWDDDTGHVTKGWGFLNEKYWKEEAWFEHDGHLRVKVTGAPNTL